LYVKENDMASKKFLLTKIIATLGPATSGTAMIKKLIASGVRVFRINFSHGTFEDYDKLLVNIRKAQEESGKFVAILGDLSGPKIRVGKVVEGGVKLKKGDEIIFRKKDVMGGSPGNEKTFSTTFPPIIEEVKTGEKILLDDGNIEMVCISKSGKGMSASLHCKVLNGNLLSSGKGINLPESELKVPSLTEKDIQCVAYAVKKEFDFLALSFVRSGKDVRELKKLLTSHRVRPKGLDITGGDLGFSTLYDDDFIPVISKIEKPQAIENLDSILEETDGIMVARGDLGVEMDLAEVAILQKQIVRKCSEYGKPVIVATQMLQSMIHDPVPTRAEVSDVANAIIDGADAVMLSGETAVGNYPEETVKMMNRIAEKTNDYVKAIDDRSEKLVRYKGPLNRKATMARGVHQMARDIKAKFIITWTHSGGSSVFLSQQRIEVPLIAFGENKKRLQQLSLLYGITPMHMDQPASGSDFIETVNALLLKKKWAKKGDAIIIVASDPITKKGITNRMVIHYLGEELSG
jgi:pyruvate kinase